MKKLLLFVAIFLFSTTSVYSAAFNSQLSPGKIIAEGNRGDTMEYTVRFTNLLEEGGPQLTNVLVQDFYFDDTGQQVFLDEDAVLDPQQSLKSWIDVESQFEAYPDKPVELPVRISIPENAGYGDHNAALYFSAQRAGQNAAMVGVQARLATNITVKVLGGNTVLAGEVSDLAIDVRERARNTATVSYDFQNTGTEFFRVVSRLEIFDVPQPRSFDEPIKVVSREDSVFPNVRKKVALKVGDLGEDYGEDQYYARVKVYEKGRQENTFLSVVKPFQYYLPLLEGGLREAAPTPVVQEPVYTEPVLIAFMREFGLYVGIFIVALIVLIRVLFFSGSVQLKSSKSGKK